MKLTLAYKCMILIAVPVCFELTFFTLLLDIQNSTARESARIGRSQLIATTINKVCLDVLLLEDSFKSEVRPLEAAKNIDLGTMRLIDRFRLLDRLTTDYPEVHKSIEKYLIELEKTRDELDNLRSMVVRHPEIDPVSAAQSLGPTFKYHIRRIAYGGLFQLASEVAAEFDADSREKARTTTITLLKAAVAISIFIAGLSAFFLSRSLTSRIETLIGNAALLGDKKPLLPPIGGNDEIFLLDKAMHEASELIASLERAREEIISMVGHDIRSPVATIKCAAESLQMRLEETIDSESMSVLSEIDSNSDKILRISQDLLDMQRLSAGSLTLDLRLFDIRKCLSSAVSTVQGLSQRRSVHVEIIGPTLEAMVDEFRLEQVVVNLLTNAIKFSPVNGKVILELQTTANPDSIHISVLDHGPGISDSMKESIFEPFVQVSKSDGKRGSGLGLAIAKALVELHNGTITCNNAASGGCVFSVVLPWRK